MGSFIFIVNPKKRMEVFKQFFLLTLDAKYKIPPYV